MIKESLGKVVAGALTLGATLSRALFCASFALAIAFAAACSACCLIEPVRPSIWCSRLARRPVKRKLSAVSLLTCRASCLVAARVAAVLRATASSLSTAASVSGGTAGCTITGPMAGSACSGPDMASCKRLLPNWVCETMTATASDNAATPPQMARRRNKRISYCASNEFGCPVSAFGIFNAMAFP
jgi:hypothetical protein